MEIQTLASLIANKGIDQIDFSMLSEDVKIPMLNDAAYLFFKMDKHLDAIKSWTLAGNKAKLIEIGDWFYESAKFKLAALSYIPVKDKARLENIGQLCIREGIYGTAIKVYKELNDKAMVSFIIENFGEEDKEMGQ